MPSSLTSSLLVVFPRDVEMKIVVGKELLRMNVVVSKLKIKDDDVDGVMRHGRIAAREIALRGSLS